MAMEQYQRSETLEIMLPNGDRDSPLDRKLSPLVSSHLSTIEEPPGGIESYIDWRSSFLMLFFFIVGIVFATGHHFYYLFLDDEVVRSSSHQAWSLRIGTGLAVLTKTCLGSTIVLVSVQQIWMNLRRESLRISCIDGMFSLMNDPTSLFNKDLLLRAKILVVLAFVYWFMPVIAIITPSTLSVRAGVLSLTQDMLVQTVNFSDHVGWGTSTSYIFALTRYTFDVVPQTPVFRDYSYTLEFWGPSYKCQNVSAVTGSPEEGAMWNHTRYNYSSLQDLYDEQMGPLSTEVYRGRANQTLNNVIFVHAFGADIVCQLWNTSYNIDIRFEKGIQTIVPISRTHLQAAAFPGDVGRYSDTQRRPGVLPTFFITHLLFSELLMANVSDNTFGSSYESYQADQPVLDSALFACPELANITNLGNGTMQPWMCRNGSVASAIEDLSHNFTYSLLTFSGWAGKYSASVRALTFEPRNFYSYDAPKLLAAYAVSMFATLGCLGVGFCALRSNGVASSASFSSFLLTTRNPDLDRLADGHHLGAQPLAKDISQTELQFGQLDFGRTTQHVAFGLKGSVKKLVT